MQIRKIENELPLKLINLLVEKGIKKVALLWLEKSGISAFQNLVRNINFFEENGIEVVYQGSLGKLSFYENEIREQNDVDAHQQEIPSDLLQILKTHTSNFALIIIDDMIDSGITTEAVRRLIRKNFQDIAMIFYVMFDKISERRKWTPGEKEHEFYLWGHRETTDCFLGGYGSNFWINQMRRISFVFGCDSAVYDVLKSPNNGVDCFREEREKIISFLLEFDEFFKSNSPPIVS